jgi:HAD superfamily hydrolase (TIGR01509 family)
MIQAVITDCFGMLYPDPVTNYRHDGRTADHIVAALQDIHDRASTGEIKQQDYVKRAAWLLKKPDDKVAAEFFGGTNRDEAALAYLIGLRPRYKVVLLSNAGAGMIEARFSLQELERFFDMVVLSYVLKTAKPDPAIYRWTCEQLGLQPEEMVVIDDTPANCEAARAIGMKAVQYRSFEQTREEIEAILAADRPGAVDS